MITKGDERTEESLRKFSETSKIHVNNLNSKDAWVIEDR